MKASGSASGAGAGAEASGAWGDGGDGAGADVDAGAGAGVGAGAGAGGTIVDIARSHLEFGIITKDEFEHIASTHSRGRTAEQDEASTVDRTATQAEEDRATVDESSVFAGADMDSLAATLAAELPDPGKEKDILAGLCARMSQNDPTYTELRLVNNKHLDTLPAAERNAVFHEFCQALQKNPHVTSVVVVNSGGTDALAEAMAGVLKVNGSVKAVNLESNNIWEKGMVALAEAVGLSATLAELRLSNQRNPMSTKAIEAFVEAVEGNGVTHVCALGTSHMRDKAMQTRLGRALSSNLDGVRLARHAASVDANLAGTRLTGVQERINALPTCTDGELDLHGSALFRQMAPHWQEQRFCARLAGNLTITVLDLSALALRDEFCVEFAEHVLQPSTKLREIKLSDNAFTGKGVVAVVKALVATQATKAKLSNQKNPLGAAAAAELLLVLATPSALTTLELDWRATDQRSAAQRHLSRNSSVSARSGRPEQPLR